MKKTEGSVGITGSRSKCFCHRCGRYLRRRRASHDTVLSLSENVGIQQRDRVRRRVFKCARFDLVKDVPELSSTSITHSR